MLELVRLRNKRVITAASRIPTPCLKALYHADFSAEARFMHIEEQGEVIGFLNRDFGQDLPVETMTTHASIIFLAGQKVYKLKRAVRFPYLDYSTPQLRHAACLAEFELNRRTAPELYLGVRTITRDAGGSLMLDGPGPLVDAVVEMRRFDQQCLLDHIAQHGTLTPALISDLAHRIAIFHGEASVHVDRGGRDGIAGVLDINDRALRATSLVPADVAAVFADRFQQTLQEHSGLLERRRLAGKVRHCHGDLILRNICLWQGTPTLFDCIEFDESLAIIDVLYDLAFLLMDLWHRGQHQAANLLLNRYLDEADETDGLGLIPFFMAIRAAVRAHVTAAQADHAEPDTVGGLAAEAWQYFRLAETLLEPSRPVLVAVGGFSGTGKSTIASLVAPHLGPAPGARILNSDRLRKKIHSVPVHARLPETAYRQDVSEHVYEALRQEAERVLRAGSAVIVDAVFDRPSEREKLNQLAVRNDVRLEGYWLQAPTALLMSRVAARRNDPSDATVDVVRMQTERSCGEISWMRLDTARESTLIRDDILRHQHVAGVPPNSRTN